jgi:hypothetical protein
MENLTVTEVQQLKKSMELQIADLLMQFEKKTGVEIDDIQPNFQRQETVDCKRISSRISVKIKALI